MPAGTAGGEYTVKVTHPFHRPRPGASGKFDVRAYRAPRLKCQIVFLRDGYGPGDTRRRHAARRAGRGRHPGGRQGHRHRARGRGGGRPVGDAPSTHRGNCSAQFKLPKTIARGEGTLAFVIEDGGVVETATKTIPILLQTSI